MFNQFNLKRAFACLYLFAILLSLFVVEITGQSSGGNFTMQKSVVAGGGTTSSGGSFSLAGTVGQTAAGDFSQNATFNERSGFWASDVQAPTAAESFIAGCVTDLQSGEGIEGVRIILTDIFTNDVQETTTNGKGNYAFTGVAVGKFYVITAIHRRYTLIPPQQVLSLVGDTTDLNFVAARNVN